MHKADKDKKPNILRVNIGPPKYSPKGIANKVKEKDSHDPIALYDKWQTSPLEISYRLSIQSRRRGGQSKFYKSALQAWLEDHCFGLILPIDFQERKHSLEKERKGVQPIIIEYGYIVNNE